MNRACRRGRPVWCAALLLALGLLLGALTGADAAGEAPQRHRYTLDLYLDTQRRLLYGTQTVQAVNDSDCDWDSLRFRDYATVATLASRDGYRDENGTEILIEPDENSSQYADIVDLDTGAQLSYTRREGDPSVVLIALDEPLKPGESRTIQFSYAAQIFHGRGNLCWYEKDGVTYFNLGNFYPVLTCFENGAWAAYPYSRAGEYFYSPISEYRVSLTAPAGYTAAASSAIETVCENGNGTVTWQCAPAALRDFALCLSDGFAVKETDQNGTTVLSYYPAGSEETGERDLDTAVRALALFGEMFDYPYPYETFSVVRTPIDLAGMEFPGLVMVYAPDPIETVAHETAHQWFYAIVGSDSGEEPWLDESLATFSGALYLKASQPDQYLPYIEDRRRLGEGGAAFRVGASVLDLGESSYSRVVYSRGCAFLYDLCEAMGEEAFFTALRGYVKTYALGEAHTADFVRIFLKECAGNTKARAVMEEYLFPVFGDVEEGPAASTASLVAAYGVMTGTSGAVFGPDETLTRAQAAAVLYRLAGSPPVLEAPGFDDVPADSWYAKAAGWARMEGITNGVSAQHFAPERTVTKGEFRTLLARFFGVPAGSGQPDGGSPLTRIEAAAMVENALREARLI